MNDQADQQASISSTDGRPLPRYQGEEARVWALNIAGLVIDPIYGTATITPADEGFQAFKASKAWVDKHQPEVGAYYVIADDGKASTMSASTFEERYTQL